MDGTPNAEHLSALLTDKDFMDRWPYVGARLRNILVQRQFDFAAANKGKHEEVGRYCSFTQELVDLFDSISGQGNILHLKTPRKKLNNSNI
jgi:hypothetical protein